MMHIFLDHFHQGGEYSTQIAIQQEKLRTEETLTDQNSLSISTLQTAYLNLDSRSGFRINGEIANTYQKMCTFCGGANHSAEKCFKRIRQEKEKPARLVNPTTDKRNGHLENVLDADLKIT